MEESEYIIKTIQSARGTLGLLPKEFQRLKKESEQQIDQICERAGISGEIQTIKDNLEKFRTKLQSQVDALQGQISVLESIHTMYHLAPIPHGVTHMFGVALKDLDPYVRLRVMGGWDDHTWGDFITSLGGDPRLSVNEWVGKPVTQVPQVPQVPPVEEDIEPSVYDFMDATPSPSVPIKGPVNNYTEDTDEEEEEYQRVMEEELRGFEQRVEAGTATAADLEAIKALSILAKSRR
jgi:hypothetical protein